MANLYIISAIFCWGIWSILNKISVSKIGPYYTQMTAYIMYIAFIPIFIFMNCHSQSEPRKDNTGFLFALFAAICSSIASFCYSSAIKYKDVSYVLSATSCYPVVGFILSVIFLNEIVTLNKVFGFILMILGAYLINNNNR